MKDFVFNTPKLDTMVGTEKGSTYIVFAKAKNLRMGMRVFPAPHLQDKTIWAIITVRLRVENSDGSSCSKEMATEAFGDFNFYESTKHSSSILILPLIALPASPAELYLAYSALEGLEEDLIAQIKNRFSSSVTFSIDPIILVDWLRERISDFIPDVKAKIYGKKEFICLIEPKKE